MVKFDSGTETIENRNSGFAGVTQLVECDLAKVDVAGSNPVSRSIPPILVESKYPIPHQ